jgi:flagellum-specific peptidoglycan hydrolase FlgJ
MSKQTEFFKKYGDAVVESTNGTKIFPSVKLAQMALETGYGASIKVAANNAYGLKAGKSWTGKVISNSTFEDDADGNRTHYSGTGKIYNSYTAAINDGSDFRTLFRVYSDVSGSIRDYNKLLLRPRYAAALNATTPEEQARLLKECGYATGYDYDNILVQIINQYNLKEFDKKKVL